MTTDLRALNEAKAKWDWLHRWEALGKYNAEGGDVTHSPEFVALMREQQAAFDRERAATEEARAS